MIREAKKEDLDAILLLYLHLHESQLPENRAAVLSAWQKILADPDHHLIVCEQEGRIVSSCVCVIVPNLTRGARPYALIENVVTHQTFRGRGYATACLDYACELAQAKHCYKVMLMTGAKDEKTLSFYRRAGFASDEKTAFIKRL